MLRTALGAEIASWLDDESVVEIMLNPDGRFWFDRLMSGLEDTGARLSAEDGERIIRLVAHHVGAEVPAGAPRVSAELPETGERFEGILPPVVYAPAFAIRKPAIAVFSLDDYVAIGIMTKDQAAILRASVSERKNILVAGGTSTGKTTLANALLTEIAKTDDRVVLIEDTRELQCARRRDAHIHAVAVRHLVYFLCRFQRLECCIRQHPEPPREKYRHAVLGGHWRKRHFIFSTLCRKKYRQEPHSP
jgi:type IV secretion system protein TrbB